MVCNIEMIYRTGDTVYKGNNSQSSSGYEKFPWVAWETLEDHKQRNTVGCVFFVAVLRALWFSSTDIRPQWEFNLRYCGGSTTFESSFCYCTTIF